MAKVKIQGHASGTGVFTLTSPNSNTDRTITLPDADVTLGTDATKLPLAGGTMTGQLNLNSNLDMGDNHYIAIGAGDDLQLWHDGTNSHIKNTAGTLFINSDGLTKLQDAGANETFAEFNDNSAVNLYYDNVKKFETTNAGITAQGRLEIQTANDSATHLVQRMGSTDGSYGYVDLELVSPNSTAAGLPRLDLQVGNSTVASFLRGGGITFNGDTATANALDDYEEGSWTPVMNGTSSNTIQATYVKVGNMVTCHMMNWGFTATAVTCSITGLPFTSTGAYVCGTCASNSWTENGAGLWGYTAATVTVSDCVNMDDATGRAGSPRYFSMSITYRTT